jgi:hypothetical protein
MRMKTTCVTLVVFSCEKFWPDFWCGNMQLEVVLGAWKGVPYVERLCRGYDLGKVKDENHLFFVCLNIPKVREHFCLALPLTHMSTLAGLM